MADWEIEEAKRRYTNAEADKDKIRRMRSEMADMLSYACTQAIAARGVRVDDKTREELAELIERKL